MGNNRFFLASGFNILHNSGISAFPYFLAYVLYERLKFGSSSRLPTIADTSTKAIIVLNGGSLTNQSVGDPLQCDFFVCNEFCRTDRFAEIRPKHYVLADQQYYMGSITASGQPVRIETISILNERTSWDMTVYIPLEARREDFAGRLPNPRINLSYYSKAPLPGTGKLSQTVFLRTAAMPYLSNVSVAMVALSVKLGYRVLDIYGLDMTSFRNFMVDSRNQTFIRNSYFYTSGVDVEPYMISSKAKGGYVRGNATIFFQRMYQTLAMHEQLAALTSSIADITNHSQDSVVDSYKRGSP